MDSEVLWKFIGYFPDYLSTLSRTLLRPFFSENLCRNRWPRELSAEVENCSRKCNIFKNKENVESMLNESLNQFKFDSTHFQQAFNNVERPVQTPPTFGSTKC